MRNEKDKDHEAAICDFDKNDELLEIKLSGASSKDAGKKITTISKADNRKLYYPMIEELLQQPALRLR